MQLTYKITAFPSVFVIIIIIGNGFTVVLLLFGTCRVMARFRYIVKPKILMT